MPNISWIPSVASSSDGTKLIAVGYQNGILGGGIYTSTNSGTTWTATGASGDSSWQSVASSADGSILVAVGAKSVYTSVDSGKTWQVTGAPNQYWWSVASSADGAKLIAASGWIGLFYLRLDLHIANYLDATIEYRAFGDESRAFLDYPFDEFCATTKPRPDHDELDDANKRANIESHELAESSGAVPIQQQWLLSA